MEVINRLQQVAQEIATRAAECAEKNIMLLEENRRLRIENAELREKLIATRGGK
jgi:regulator of replication initiation timing